MGVLEEWLDSYAAKSTTATFRSALSFFLAFVYDLPDAEDRLRLVADLADQYVSEVKCGKREPFRDVLAFAAFLHRENKPPKTAATYVAAVKSFLSYSLDVEFTRKQEKMIRSRMPKGSRARTEDGPLPPEVLRKILTHTDVKGRALFLLLASSGIRIGEALQLRFEDIDLNHDPPIIKVRGEYTKAGDAYYSFLTSEAKEALLEWLKVREDYIKTAARRGRGLQKTGYGRGVKHTEDERIFPFSKFVALSLWANAVRKAGLESRDRSTNRRKLHIHSLRKFFRTQLGKSRMPEDIREALMGHKSGLDRAYRRYTQQQIAEEYKKAEGYLLVNVPEETRKIQEEYSVELEKANKRIQDLTIKLTDVNSTMIKLIEENRALQRRVSELNEENLDLKQKLEELEDFISKRERHVQQIIYRLEDRLARLEEELERREIIEKVRREWAEEEKEQKQENPRETS